MGIPGIIGGIGLLYIILNIAAIKASKDNQRKGIDRHVSGIPFLGGIHLLLAGLISPIKWLALICFTDFTIWMFLYAVIIKGAFKDVSGEDKNE